MQVTQQNSTHNNSLKQLLSYLVFDESFDHFIAILAIFTLLIAIALFSPLSHIILTPLLVFLLFFLQSLDFLCFFFIFFSTASLFLELLHYSLIIYGVIFLLFSLTF